MVSLFFILVGFNNNTTLSVCLLQVGMHVLSVNGHRTSQLPPQACGQLLAAHNATERVVELSFQPDTVVQVDPGPLGLELKADDELVSPVIINMKPGCELEKAGAVWRGQSLVHVTVADDVESRAQAPTMDVLAEKPTPFNKVLASTAFCC